jgi:peptidoglycan hydrolase-like protein with peptidoglycan-binding domain
VAELTGDEPDLKVGDSGEGVVLLQVRLYGLGLYQDVPDGTFNMTTENAVRELQSQRGHDNDGEVTRETWEAILYFEQQYGIQYQYHSPYDALSQIRYDRDHREEGGEYGEAGQAGYPSDDGGHYGQYSRGGTAGQDGYVGQLSEDGQWQWDGTDWQPANTGGSYPAAGEDAQSAGYAGQLSEDGQWRWDGSAWRPATDADVGYAAATTAAVQADDYVGQLSEDGQWRWDGAQWQAA